MRTRLRSDGLFWLGYVTSYATVVARTVLS